jgi:hypothetical protein
VFLQHNGTHNFSTYAYKVFNVSLTRNTLNEVLALAHWPLHFLLETAGRGLEIFLGFILGMVL